MHRLSHQSLSRPPASCLIGLLGFCQLTLPPSDPQLMLLLKTLADVASLWGLSGDA